MQLEFQRTTALRHPESELFEFPGAGVQRGLALRHLVPEPFELALALLRRGPEGVTLGGEGGNLGFGQALIMQLEFQRTTALCHPESELFEFPGAGVQRGLALRHLVPEPIELALTLLRRGPEGVTLGGEGTDLGFHFSLVLQLSFESADDLPEFFRLPGTLRHPESELFEFPGAGVQRGLALRHLVPEPLELALTLLRRGPEGVTLGGEGTDLGFEFGPSLEDFAPLALQNSQAMSLLFEFLPSAPEPFAQGIEDGNEAPGVADRIHQNLVVPGLFGKRMLFFVVGIRYRFRHGCLSDLPDSISRQSRRNPTTEYVATA
jgi:hypothetical protein